MNILTDFKIKLGHVNATNQYIELAVRQFENNHQSDSLTVLARDVGLSIEVLPDEVRVRIANGYIVTIHSIVESFLRSFVKLEGLPFKNVTPYNPESDKSRLSWVMENLISTIFLLMFQMVLQYVSIID